jgi:hypothetical protein
MMRWQFSLVVILAMAASLQGQPPPISGPPASPSPGSPGTTPAARQFTNLIPSLIDALKDSDSEVRQHAAMSLAAIGPESIKPLTESLTDPIVEKRAAAAYALGHMGYEGHDAIPALLKSLKDDDASVRRAASQAISRILSDEVIEPSRALPRYRGRNTSGLPGLTIPGTQSGTIPPLDPVPSEKNPKK